MANVKISALPAATSVAAADTLPIVQSATTKKATFQNVIDAVVSNEPGTSFRNRIINGDFSVNQRGFTSTTTTLTYGQDRWRLVASDGTVTYSAQAFTAGNPITGQEPINYARLVTTGQTLTSAEAALIQPIEDVRTFAGQQVTVSFWAKSASGTPKIAIEFEQRFGSGGSPSGVVQTYGGQATISTSWARYSVTFTVPSISGKTIGTDANSSSVWAKLYVSAGTALNARTGSLGIQTNTFDIWGVQVEAGSTASAFERRPIGAELQLCQRYYQAYGFKDQAAITNAVQYSATEIYGAFTLQTPMRAAPTYAGTNSTNAFTKYANNAGTGFNTFTVNATNTTDRIIEFAASVAGTGSHACWVRANGATTNFSLNAEL